MLYFCKVGDSMEYKCPKCDAILTHANNKFICEYCKSEYDVDYFNSEKTYDYIIPFDINKDSAIKIYKQNIKSVLLTPSLFKQAKNIQPIYVPCYLYNLDCTGEVDFQGNKTSTWKSSGTKYKKVDTYKLVRGGDLKIKDMLISITTGIEDDIISYIEPYDYNKKIKFENLYLKEYKLYDADMIKDKIIESVKNKAKKIFAEEMRKDIKEYNDVDYLDNFVNFHNSNKITILVPIYVLNINYKNKNYKYVINGQTGIFYGDIKVNKNRIFIIGLLLFVIVFIVLLLLNINKVILW